MARGNCIVVSTDPKGKFVEGTIGAGLTVYPGMAMQIQPATDPVGGRDVWEIYAPGADGEMPKGPIIILTESLIDLPTVAYTAGLRAFGYVPLPGDELNVLLKDVAGTGDDHTKGEKLILDTGTGKFIATTGSPEEEVAILRETVTDPAADQLVWVTWQR